MTDVLLVATLPAMVPTAAVTCALLAPSLPSLGPVQPAAVVIVQRGPTFQALARQRVCCALLARMSRPHLLLSAPYVLLEPISKDTVLATVNYAAQAPTLLASVLLAVTLAWLAPSPLSLGPKPLTTAHSARQAATPLVWGQTTVHCVQQAPTPLAQVQWTKEYAPCACLAAS